MRFFRTLLNTLVGHQVKAGKEIEWHQPILAGATWTSPLNLVSQITNISIEEILETAKKQNPDAVVKLFQKLSGNKYFSFEEIDKPLVEGGSLNIIQLVSGITQMPVEFLRETAKQMASRLNAPVISCYHCGKSFANHLPACPDCSTTSPWKLSEEERFNLANTLIQELVFWGLVGLLDIKHAYAIIIANIINIYGPMTPEELERKVPERIEDFITLRYALDLMTNPRPKKIKYFEVGTDKKLYLTDAARERTVSNYWASNKAIELPNGEKALEIDIHYALTLFEAAFSNSSYSKKEIPGIPVENVPEFTASIKTLFQKSLATLNLSAFSSKGFNLDLDQYRKHIAKIIAQFPQYIRLLLRRGRLISKKRQGLSYYTLPPAWKQKLDPGF